MALITNLATRLVATLTKTPGLTTPDNPLIIDTLLTLASGIGAGQADRMYTGTRSIPASSNEDLDLAGGLTDEFGVAITFARVKVIYARASAANANNVVIGAAAANQWVTFLNAAGTATLRPGSAVLATAGKDDATGWAVTAASGDLLRVANGGAGTSVAYDLVIIGASA